MLRRSALDRRGVARATEKETLALRASEGTKSLGLLWKLDTFCDHFEAHRLAKDDDRVGREPGLRIIEDVPCPARIRQRS